MMSCSRDCFVRSFAEVSFFCHEGFSEKCCASFSTLAALAGRASLYRIQMLKMVATSIAPAKGPGAMPGASFPNTVRVCMRKRNFVRQENQGLSGQTLQ